MRTAQALLDGIIDYAGLFPPAELAMDEAFSRFLRHRRAGDGWILGRFVVPVSRLPELERLIDAVATDEAPFRLAILGRGGATLEDFTSSLTDDAAVLAGFRDRMNERASADVFEVRLPEAGGAAVAVETAWRVLTHGGTVEMTPYFEASILGEWRPRLPAAVAAVRDADRAAGSSHRVGLKIRCGGLTAEAVPTPEAVAAAIATCRATGVSLKATQGLHQPYRHHDAGLDTMVHGFLNVFAAGVLAHARDVPVTRLTEIVAETDPSAFVVSDDRLAWRDLEASADEVGAARSRLLTTFGSCSFSEPCDELRSLSLIE